MSLVGVAQTGDYRATLEVLRDRLAQEIDECVARRDLAALADRFTHVLAQIDAIPTSQQVSAADEIAQRRVARRGARAKDKARASGAG